MDYRYRRRPKRRVTGRFYAFLTVLLIVCVGFGVFLKERGSASQPPTSLEPKPIYDYTQLATQTPAVQPTAAPAPETKTMTLQTTPPEATPDPQGGAQPDQTLPPEGDGFILPEEDLPVLAPQDVVVVDSVHARTDLPQEWRNILLLGSDARNLKKMDRCDTIIIASINTNTGKIKLTSIMRDTIVNIPKHGQQKINACTYYGGPELAMQVVNDSFGMNITEYVLVNFGSMAKVIDILDGVLVDISKEEKDVINRHIGEVAKYIMDQDYYKAHKEELQLQNHGKSMRLSGIQAVTYARIRELDSDYERTTRQKRVLSGIMARVKGADLGQMMQLATSMWGNFDTNCNMLNSVQLAFSVMQKGGEMKDWRLPGKDTYSSKTGKQGAGFYDVDYAENTLRLHEFIYGSRIP